MCCSSVPNPKSANVLVTNPSPSACYKCVLACSMVFPWRQSLTTTLTRESFGFLCFSPPAPPPPWPMVEKPSCPLTLLLQVIGSFSGYNLQNTTTMKIENLWKFLLLSMTASSLCEGTCRFQEMLEPSHLRDPFRVIVYSTQFTHITFYAVLVNYDYCYGCWLCWW